MTNQKSKKEYRAGKIKALVETVALYAAGNPDLILDCKMKNDWSLLHATLSSSLEGYGKRDICFNCGYHMKIAVYTAGIMQGLLLMRMAEAVAKAKAGGKTFTEANCIHIPSLITTDGIRHSITQASYLNLVAQPKKSSQSGHWAITSRGWAALTGKPIPKYAKYWRGELIERSEEMTTLSEMFRTHTAKVIAAIARRKAVKEDYRADISQYDATKWIEYVELDIAAEKQLTLI